jgi:hypothetical protein
MTSSLMASLDNYLETLLGQRPELSKESNAALPLFLREKYSIYSIHLFGHKFLVALSKTRSDSASPSGGELKKHAERLSTSLGAPTVLVFRSLPSYLRNRLVHSRVPFIVPGKQAFIPPLLDLRERFDNPVSEPRETLSPAAQCTVLYHLLREPISEVPLKDVAQKVHYSPMMMSKVKDELTAAKVCEEVQAGRSVVLQFAAKGKTVWENAKPRLASPVRRKHNVQWSNPVDPALLAGITALSLRSMIADDNIPTYALKDDEYRRLLEHHALSVSEDSDRASAIVEEWSYDPTLLGNGRMVDPLSLYLSLQNSPDERVQQQLETMIEEVQW